MKRCDSALKSIPKLKVGDSIRIIEHPMNVEGEAKKQRLVLNHHKGKVTGTYPNFINFRNKRGYIESINNIDIRTGRIEVVKVG